MTVVALIGDCTTTTALALVAAWPADDDVVIVEADRSGGSLAAWLDTPASPTLSAIVASAGSAGAPLTWGSIEPHVNRSLSGVRFIATPVRSLEANRAVAEANAAVFPLLARVDAPTCIADLGRHSAAERPPLLAALAETIVVVHRQREASAAASGVRLERCAELVESLEATGVPIVLAVIGDRPFDLAEIERYVSADGGRDVTACRVADDSLAAAVLAGRRGVSRRRLARLPLMRSMRRLAAAVTPPVDPVAATSDASEVSA